VAPPLCCFCTLWVEPILPIMPLPCHGLYTVW
jgi:hypothetical protein